MHHGTLFKRIYNDSSPSLFSSSYVQAKFAEVSFFVQYIYKVLIVFMASRYFITRSFPDLWTLCISSLCLPSVQIYQQPIGGKKSSHRSSLQVALTWYQLPSFSCAQMVWSSFSPIHRLSKTYSSLHLELVCHIGFTCRSSLLSFL